MKKLLSIVLAAALLLGVFCVPALAEEADMIKLLMSTPGVALSQPDKAQCASAEELDDAAERGAELIPADCTLVPGRITVLQTKNICCEEEVYNVTFKVWTTAGRTVALFFRAQDGESWELVTCTKGDVLEAHLEESGTYTIAVGW